MNAGTHAVLLWIDVTSGNNGRVSGGINHILYLHFWKTIKRGPPYWSPLYIPSVILTLKLTRGSGSADLRKVLYAVPFLFFPLQDFPVLPWLPILSPPCHPHSQCSPVHSSQAQLPEKCSTSSSLSFFFLPESLQKNLFLFLPLILAGRVPPLYKNIWGSKKNRKPSQQVFRAQRELEGNFILLRTRHWLCRTTQWD